MRVSRRDFLRWATALVTLGGCGTGDPTPGESSAPVGTVGDRSPASASPAEPTALSQSALEVLRKLTEVFTGIPYSSDFVFEDNHYDSYFQWWAERLPRRGALYEHLGRALEQRAQESFGKPFTGCDAEACLDLIEGAFGGEQKRLFVEQIQRPILKIYTDTDAWIDMGYESWRGRPRGLESYRQPPPGAGLEAGLVKR